MTPTLYVVRVSGHGDDHLSLHTTEEGAARTALRVTSECWYRRFGWTPASDAPPLLRMQAMESEGWRASVEELPVELDAPEPAAGHPADRAVAEADATL